MTDSLACKTVNPLPTQRLIGVAMAREIEERDMSLTLDAAAY